MDADFTSGFQLGQCSIPVSTSQTTSRVAAISVSLVPATGACGLIPRSADSGSSWMTRVFIRCSSPRGLVHSPTWKGAT